MCKAQTPLLNPANSNLQAESINTIAKNHAQRVCHTTITFLSSKPQRANLRSIFATLILAACIILPAQSAKEDLTTFHWCPLTTLFAIPKPTDCEVTPEKLPMEATITLCTKNLREAEAFSCFSVSREVCTKTFLLMTLAVTKDETTKTPISSVVCHQLISNKHWGSITLERMTNDSWSSQHPVQYTYAWISSSCYTTSNLHLQAGTVATIDD